MFVSGRDNASHQARNVPTRTILWIILESIMQSQFIQSVASNPILDFLAIFPGSSPGRTPDPGKISNMAENSASRILL